MLAVVYADHRLSTGEAVLVSRAMQSWELDLTEIGNLVFSFKPDFTEIESDPAILKKTRPRNAQESTIAPSILATHF